MNIETVRELAKILKENQLSELTYQSGNDRLKLKRALTQPAAPSSPAAPEPAVSDEQNTINATTIGTFYSSKSPDDPPFVSIGDHIEIGDTIGIIEAMKVMNEIKADKAGTVTQILATDGQGVKFDEPLIQLA